MKAEGGGRSMAAAAAVRGRGVGWQWSSRGSDTMESWAASGKSRLRCGYKKNETTAGPYQLGRYFSVITFVSLHLQPFTPRSSLEL